MLSKPCRKVLYPELSVILFNNSQEMLRLVAVTTSFQSILIYYLQFRLLSMLQDKLAAAWNKQRKRTVMFFFRI